MSFEFVFFIIFAMLSVIGFAIWRRAVVDIKVQQGKVDAVNVSSDRYAVGDRARKNLNDAKLTATLGKLSTVVTGVFAAILLMFSVFYTVPVRNVGIVTSFNKPTGNTTGSGLHPVWPWQRVADFDASIQPSLHLGTDHCITVRIGSLATACVETRIQWQVSDQSAPKLYNDYKGDFENLRNNLVESQIQNSLNIVFATYNPLSSVNLQTGAVGFDGTKLGEQVKEQLIAGLGSDIKVITVVVPLVHHDAKTEENIKAFQDVVAQSRILAQKKANADIEAGVAKTQQSYLTPEFLKNKCLELSEKMGFAPGLCLMQNGIVNAPTTK